jgi:hypothetical protein
MEREIPSLPMYHSDLCINVILDEAPTHVFLGVKHILKSSVCVNLQIQNLRPARRQ